MKAIMGGLAFGIMIQVFGNTLDNVYYTVKGDSIWKHYDESVINNKGNFYGTLYPTSIQLSFNPMVSVSKTLIQ